MHLKKNIEIDLVFKCSQSVKELQDFKNNNTLIFDSSFWEEVFRSWIKLIINERSSIKSNSFFNKKIFSLSFNIIDNNEITILNKKWLNKSGATDVISFPIILEDDLSDDLLFIELGDLFISLERASEQAIQYSNSLDREMLWLASHGFLHLLGWEHNNDNELKSMLNFQEYLLSKLI
tara:strand:+ start:253 stop:786 length:534 start_codon:yes stop_codon:yes gene_type:complete